MRDGGQAVDELHDGADGHDAGDELNNVLVGGEEARQLVAEDAEDGDVEDADDDAGTGGDTRACLRGIDESGPDEVGDACGGGDGDGEGDLEGR